MGSTGWELARMHPETAYLVEPWSIRGFESIHGSITFTIGALIFITGLLTSLEFALTPMYSRGIAALMAVGAIGMTLLYGGDERSFGGGVVGLIFAFVGGYIVSKALRPYIPDLPSMARAAINLGILIVASAILYVAFFGTSRSAEPWVWVSVVAILALGLAVTGTHAELSANRMLMFMTVWGGMAIAVSAAASRMNLLAAQLEQSGVAGQYKDTQVTSGYFIALFGMLIAFVGAVSLWASRRDVIINRLRAERQRAAAEASAAEIQAALELAQQHQREARAGK